MYSSLPILLFPENPVKVCRMLLRNYFVADRHNSVYFIRKDDVWSSVPIKEWYEAIEVLVLEYGLYYGWGIVDPDVLARAIDYLYNDGICNRLYKYIGVCLDTNT